MTSRQYRTNVNATNDHTMLFNEDSFGTTCILSAKITGADQVAQMCT